MKVEELAKVTGADPDKYRKGLGCQEFALCPTGYDAARMGLEAARRALSRWPGRLSDIGLIAVGTETAADMSRPLSAFIAEGLELRGAVRSYEVKHACYGGTLALKQAVEWQKSGASNGKAALVIATDVSLYGPMDPGEPTQGAGAVAMIVGAPHLASIDARSYAYSAPAFDFWRPVGEAYPRVDGQLSLDCYRTAAEQCFSQWLKEDPEGLARARALCFHVPFPKMVKKAVQHLGESLGMSEAEVSGLYEWKVERFMGWNRKSGNTYTAALWFSVARALADASPRDELVAFSYGSGFGSELLTLCAGEGVTDRGFVEDLDRDLQNRTFLSADEYRKYREQLPPALGH